MSVAHGLLLTARVPVPEITLGALDTRRANARLAVEGLVCSGGRLRRMVVALVKMTLTGGSQSLNTNGGIYKWPYSSTAEPVKDNVNLQKGEPKYVELPKGDYDYEFDTRDGDGAFTVSAYDAHGTLLNSKPFDGTTTRHLIFTFKVPQE
jgi:hypothetical protein